MEFAGYRFIYKGEKERLPEIEAALKEEHISRKGMYLVLKYFELNPDGLKALESQFPNV